MNPVQLFKCLADETRLRCLLLIQAEGELCVCELTTALDLSQPKVSRHLAQLRDCGVLSGRRDGQWVHYALDESLPEWVRQLVANTAAANPGFTADNQRLLAAIVPSGDGPYYFKFLGPSATMGAHAEAFDGLLQSIVPSR